MYRLYNPGVDKKLMSNNIQHGEQLGVLQKFASLLGLITASLYFVGWIYRWQYYGFFQLDIITLNFSFQSFLFLPLQVFFGSIQAVIKTILAIILIAILIDIVIWLIEGLGCNLNNHNIEGLDRNQSSTESYIIQKFKLLIAKIGRLITRYNFIKLDYLKFLIFFIKEIIVIVAILAGLFFIAKPQGIADARRDAINKSSTLPVITLIIKEEKTVLGRKLDDIFTNPTLKVYRIFGDKGLFDDIRTTELNDLYDREEPRVWRLLLEQDNWLYLIRTLHSNVDAKRRPPVLAIQKASGEQMMILSPEPVTPKTP